MSAKPMARICDCKDSEIFWIEQEKSFFGAIFCFEDGTNCRLSV